jgi:hypothetical protein
VVVSREVMLRIRHFETDVPAIFIDAPAMTTTSLVLVHATNSPTFSFLLDSLTHVEVIIVQAACIRVFHVHGVSGLPDTDDK